MASGNSNPNYRHGNMMGGKASKTYSSWRSILSRCNYPNAIGYHRYGGRGIVVCDRWKNFNNFLADMGERPDGTTLDRINNDGNYETGNCRWATTEEQNSNRADNHFITLDDKTLTVRQWSRFLGISVSTIMNRLHRGYTVEKVLSKTKHSK